MKTTGKKLNVLKLQEAVLNRLLKEAELRKGVIAVTNWDTGEVLYLLAPELELSVLDELGVDDSGGDIEVSPEVWSSLLPLEKKELQSWWKE
jgi:hypothetical protein